MKRYKLLKDLPTIKAGTIFEERERHNYKILVARDIGRMYEIDVELIEDFDDWFEEIKSFEVPDEFEMGFWTIMYGEDGFYTWHLPSDEFEEDYEEKLKQYMEIGWAFESEQEAEKHLEWLKARAVILEDTKGLKPDWSDFIQPKWYVEYDHKYFNFDIKLASSQNNGGIYFTNHEDAENSLETHKKEWKIYLGVGDENNWRQTNDQL